MKKVFLALTIVASIGLIACGSDEKKDDKKEKEKEGKKEKEPEDKEKTSVYFYGDTITTDGAMNPTEFLAAANGQDSIVGKLTTTINQTCRKKGCWMTLDMGEGSEMMVRFKDYGFFVPKEGVDGKTAYVEGYAKIDTVSVEMQKHYLDDRAAAGEEVPQEEYDAITEPKVELFFLAHGAIITDAE